MSAEVTPLPLSGVHPFTDEALALRFADAHAHDLRYVAAWGRWLFWDGRRWIFDDTKLALDRVRAVCRVVAANCTDSGIKRTLGSASTVAAVERLAKADRRLAARPSDLYAGKGCAPSIYKDAYRLRRELSTTPTFDGSSRP